MDQTLGAGQTALQLPATLVGMLARAVAISWLLRLKLTACGKGLTLPADTCIESIAMSNLADVFQLVVCLPNVPEKKGLPTAVKEGLARLEQAEPGIRTLYAARLATRARHHKARADQIATQFQSVRAIDLRNAADENALRDFHHAVYYAGYFLGRFALVSNDSYDCSEHREIDIQLCRIDSREDVKRLAVELSTKLGIWRRAREVADYIMSEQRLKEFGDQALLQSTRNELEAVFTSWSVP
ncbi:MAG TPA: hypothetical protein DCQ33_08385 [Nitrospira sp.]|nr:hypothetical protein [Nitrospira sp.]